MTLFYIFFDEFEVKERTVFQLTAQLCSDLMLMQINILENTGSANRLIVDTRAPQIARG